MLLILIPSFILFGCNDFHRSGLEVGTATSGEDPDTDGYVTTVDGSSSKDIGPNGSVTFLGLDEGDHQVELWGIASNCSVDGQNPKTVSITDGKTVLTTFRVTCEASSNSRNAALWEYEEWSVQNSSYSGNPFDVIATVTFDHQGSSKTHTTEMFYDGSDTWKFRFTGTQTGTWTFTTSSSDPELDGLSGSVEVDPNSDSDAYGFTKKSSVDPEKWAREKGSPGQEEAFVPQLVMWNEAENIDVSQSVIESDIQTFLENHGFNGFHVPIARPNILLDENNNPDPNTFESLEQVISTVQDHGGHTHIWTWGDAQRGWTPPGGINSPKHKRLQRYLAARLGPLPGWSVGFGFDLDEWVTESQLHNWRDFLQGKLGWFHFLGGRPEGPNSGTDHSSWSSWNAGVDYSSYEHHEPTYEVYRAAFTAVAGQPVMSEDRFRVTDGGAGKDYTNEQTRRGLYISTMAGGVANIWGNLNTGSYADGSGPYPNEEELKTYSTFFFDKGRFRADMQPNTSITDGRALVGSSSENYVLYKQDASSVQVDLSGMNGSQPAIAVDTKEAYQEINLGTLDPESQTIDLPHSSDWVIAVGEFN